MTREMLRNLGEKNHPQNSIRMKIFLHLREMLIENSKQKF